VGVFPTETVYGIGASAFEPKAIARLFEVKRRPRFNPLIVHVETIEQVRELCEEIPSWAQRLMERFWPGPLTLVLKKTAMVADLLTAGLSTVAVRMPAHPIAISLLKAAKVPIAAPSANTYMSLSPTSVSHLQPELTSQIDFVLDGGPCEIGLESTIVGWINDRPTLLRPGGLPSESIEVFTGPLAKPSHNDSVQLAPGMAQRHYAPETPLELWSGTPPVPASARSAILSLASRPQFLGFAWQRSLSSTGDLREAASHLFSSLRELDREKPDRIYAEMAPEKDLGIAINDRLRRGAHSG
jgi:L-threonylcarbamoyladenylate synthase